MATVSTAEPRFQQAVRSCVAALRRLATYEPEPALALRLEDLSGRKKFLGQQEHDELMALVDFT